VTEDPRVSEAGPQELADQREREADELEQRSQELQSEVSDARDDWARKRSDDGVPGAPAPAGESSDSDTETQAADRGSPHGESARGGDDDNND
jgi:hypothetical protein